jgi:uncharacterized protein HemX
MLSLIGPKLLAALGVIVLGIALGFGLCDTIRVKPLQSQVAAEKAEVSKLSAQLEATIDTNNANAELDTNNINAKDAMIASLQAQVKAQNRSCDKIKKILALQGGQVNVPNNNAHDDISDMLTNIWVLPPAGR